MTESLRMPSKMLSVFAAKRFRFVAVAVLVAATAIASVDAEAKRMGGGRSFGRQSQTVQRSAPPPAQQPLQSTQPAPQAQRAQPGAATPQPAPSRSRWLGPIAGLAAGLGIAALLSHFGLGGAFAGAMANVIVIALLAMIGIWLVRKFMNRRRDPAPAYAGGSMGAGGAGNASFNHGGATEPAWRAPALGGAAAAGAAPAAAQVAVPDGFDTEAFLRSAKVHFVRLQAAWDDGNLADIREFTTPEMFAELKLDVDARGGARDQTDVVQLDAALLALETQGDHHLASVRFSGLIREEAGTAAQPFAEVWNLSKPTRGSEGWLLAGIQQLAAH
jgi:predicted lipid-binding transport protein (Tim44 family)